MDTHRKLGLVYLVLSISLLLSACGPGQAFGPTFTPSPSPTLTPTPTLTPSPTPTLPPTPTLDPTVGRIEGQLAASSMSGRMCIMLLKVEKLHASELAFTGDMKWVVNDGDVRQGQTFSFEDLEAGQYMIYNPPDALFVALLRGSGPRLTLSTTKMGQADFTEYTDALDGQATFYPGGVYYNWDGAQMIPRGGYLQDSQTGKIFLLTVKLGTSLILRTPLQNYKSCGS